MKRAFLNKKNLKIAAATGMALFCLTTAFTACLAWFASNAAVQAMGMTVSVKSTDQRFRKMTLHKYIGEDANGNLQFYREASGTYTYTYGNNSTTYTPTDPNETFSAFMGEYSLNDPRHPFLAIIEYTQAFTADSGNGKITITAQTDHQFICGVDSSTGNFYEALNTTNNPLSSVVKFSATSYSSITGIQSTTTIDSSTLNTYNLAAPEANDWDHFVEIGTDNDGNYTYDNTNGWEGYKDIISVTSGTIQYVSIIFDYYDEALGYIYNKYLGDEVLEHESVPFGCDWRLYV